ncbi:MAG TPA: ADYC domain-containing protein [Polyangiaceae bacterium]|nr:ADYC domain-containing protein [Polyangiaceae bacterium]
MTIRWHNLALVLPLATACAMAGPSEPDPAEGGAEGAVVDDDLSLHGIATNGASLNGIATNGVSLNGIATNGVSLHGIATNGVTLSTVTVEQSELVAHGPDGARYDGTGLVGAEVLGSLASGTSVSIRIDSARQADGVWFYAASYASGSSWQPLCLPYAGAAGEAIALDGRWNTNEGKPGGGSWTADPTTFTFACRGSALAKCVELGYKPWASAGGVSLRGHHQACTRLLRADYCGDGTPWTTDGVTVNLYDAVGVQADTESWSIEAEWGPDGARAISVPARQRFLNAGGPVPPCFASKVSMSAGAPGHFSTGSLVMSETLSHPSPVQ